MANWQSPHFHPHKNDQPGLAKEIKVEESEQCVAEDKFVDSKEKAVKDTTHERSLQPTMRIKIISFYIMEDDWFTAISGKGTEIEFKCVTGSFVSGQFFFFPK